MTADESRAPRSAASGFPARGWGRASLGSVTAGAGGLALAALGGIGARVGLLGVVAAQGALVVALGATIVGVTLAGVALVATRGADSVARSRAWVGAAVNLGLLIALIVSFAQGVGRPLVVEGADTGGPAAAEGGVPPLDAAALRRLRAEHPNLLPIAVSLTPADAFERARRTAEALGWEVVGSDPAAGRLDARAGTGGPHLWIRVHPAPGGAVVAIRPAGEARLEESLARIRAFSERITRS